MGKAFAWTLMITLAITSLFPILWLVITSIKPQNAILRSTPQFFFSPTFEHYRDLLTDPRAPLLRYLMNSLVVTIVATVVAVAFGALGAYGLARLRPRGHGVIGLVILGARMLPPIALVVPLYLVASNLGMLDTRTSLVLPYIALNIPLATWMLQGFFLDLPKELEEAALVDGCSRLGAFFRVILPLAGPGIAAVSVFAFILAWNDMVIALPMTLSEAVTLPPFASQVRQEEGIAWGRLGAITTFIMVPVILFTLAVQRWIISGLTSGSAKG